MRRTARSSPLRLVLLVPLPVLLAGGTAAIAQLAPPSGRPLSEARGYVIKGQSSGVQLIGPSTRASEPAARPPVATPTTTAATAAAPAAPAAATAATASPATTRPAPATDHSPPPKATAATAPRWGEPPRGQPMSSSKRLDSASLGIPLPTAVRPAAAASAPR